MAEAFTIRNDKDNAIGPANPLETALYDATGNRVTSFPTKDAVLTPLGYQQITVTSVQTLTVPQGTVTITVVIEAQSVRYRSDGVSPSASVGMLLPVGTVMSFTLANFANLKFISTVAGGIVNAEYFSVA